LRTPPPPFPHTHTPSPHDLKGWSRYIPILFLYTSSPFAKKINKIKEPH
jgi:hypothetical protein